MQVYLGGAVLWGVLLTILYALNFMWCECLDRRHKTVRKRLRAEAVAHHS